MPSFNWFDFALLVWLGIGLFRGRKHGMSEELLLVFQWLLIVVACSRTYKPLAEFISFNTPIDMVWSSLAAYIIIAMLIRSLLVKLKSMLGEKLVGSDIFGKGEYYLGMMAGVLRYLCMAVVLMALMNTRIITKAELEATEKMQAKNFEDVRFPTYGEIQQAVLFKSCSGQLAKRYIQDYLIASVVPDSKPIRTADSFGAKRESAVNEVMTGSKKAQ